MNISINILIIGIVLILFILFWIYAERGRLLLPSTWRFLKAAGLKRILTLSVLHSYIYGRWAEKYLKILGDFIFPNFGNGMRNWWINRYHGKVITNEQAKKIITLDFSIEKKDLEQIIPYSTAREIVLTASPEIAVYDCICRSRKENPCKPSDVCLVFGKPIIDFIVEHKPEKCRRISQEEALKIIDDQHNLGNVHSAWFKDAMLGRFYSICNCCKCCCLGIEAMHKYQSPMISSSGYIAEIDDSNCVLCKTCAGVCPFGAISINGKPQLNWDKCMGCGVCVDKCNSNCINLILDKNKGVPLDVFELKKIDQRI